MILLKSVRNNTVHFGVEYCELIIDIARNDLIYLLTAIGLSPGGSTHFHTNNTQNDTLQTIHRTTQQFGGLRAVPLLG